MLTAGELTAHRLCMIGITSTNIYLLVAMRACLPTVSSLLKVSL